MNIVAEFIIPSFIILIANVFSHEYGSARYEKVSAIFGWTSVIFLLIWFIFSIAVYLLIFFKIQMPMLISISKTSFQIAILSLMTALGRDYEKMLKPKAPFFEKKVKSCYKFLKRRLKGK